MIDNRKNSLMYAFKVIKYIDGPKPISFMAYEMRRFDLRLMRSSVLVVSGHFWLSLCMAWF